MIPPLFCFFELGIVIHTNHTSKSNANNYVNKDYDNEHKNTRKQRENTGKKELYDPERETHQCPNPAVCEILTRVFSMFRTLKWLCGFQGLFSGFSLVSCYLFLSQSIIIINFTMYRYTFFMSFKAGSDGIRPNREKGNYFNHSHDEQESADQQENPTALTTEPSIVCMKMLITRILT